MRRPVGAEESTAAAARAPQPSWRTLTERESGWCGKAGEDECAVAISAVGVFEDRPDVVAAVPSCEPADCHESNCSAEGCVQAEVLPVFTAPNVTTPAYRPRSGSVNQAGRLMSRGSVGWWNSYLAGPRRPLVLLSLTRSRCDAQPPVPQLHEGLPSTPGIGSAGLSSSGGSNLLIGPPSAHPIGINNPPDPSAEPYDQGQHCAGSEAI